MNEILLFVQAVVCTSLVFIAWRLDRERLYSVMVVFLILITLTGGKVAEFFGHTTNIGNVLYAAVYLATYFLIERYGKREGFHSLWVGVIAVAFFIVLSRLAVAFTGSDSTVVFNNALAATLSPANRIAFASLAAYACSQSFNVAFYIYMKTHMQHIGLWLRANTANLFAQIIDSTIFFSIAFWGVVGGSGVLDAILTGLVIKVVFMATTAWLLYMNGFEEETGREYTTISWR